MAFVIGFALIDDLTPNEQNALGNWLMLIAQVLCTNGSENYRREAVQSNGVGSSNTNETDKEYTYRLLSKTKDILTKEIEKL